MFAGLSAGNVVTLDKDKSQWQKNLLFLQWPTLSLIAVTWL